MATTRITLAALALGAVLGSGCDVWHGDAVGPDGGVVVSEDGRMALEIPEGALDEVVDVEILRVATEPGAASATYVVEPMGLVLQRPAAVVFDYDDETLDGHAPGELSIVAQREADWALLGDQRVDADDQTVSASIIALSPVVVVVAR